MKKLLYISFLAALLGGLSSCAKDELEAPSDQANPEAIRSNEAIESTDDLNIDFPHENPPIGTPAGINDDGDDEDEGRTPTSGTDTSG